MCFPFRRKRSYPQAGARKLCAGNIDLRESSTGSALHSRGLPFFIECGLWISVRQRLKMALCNNPPAKGLLPRGPNCAADACALGAWALFCRGASGAKVCAGATLTESSTIRADPRWVNGMVLHGESDSPFPVLALKAALDASFKHSGNSKMGYRNQIYHVSCCSLVC